MKTICIKTTGLRTIGYNNLKEWNESDEDHIAAVRRGRVPLNGEIYNYKESKWCNKNYLSVSDYYDMLVKTMNKEEVKIDLQGKTLGCFCHEALLPTPSLDQCVCHVQVLRHFIEDVPVLPEPNYEDVLAYAVKLGWVELVKTRETNKTCFYTTKDKVPVLVEETDETKLIELRMEFDGLLYDNNTSGSGDTSDGKYFVQEHEFISTKISKTVLCRGYGSGKWKYVIPGNHIGFMPMNDCIGSELVLFG